MSEVKHSPGPWRAAIGDDYAPRANESELEIACLSHDAFDAIDVFGPELDRELTGEELDANAHLIAAAPDLLEALKASNNKLRSIVFDGDVHPLVAANNAAIAKAEGRS